MKPSPDTAQFDALVSANCDGSLSEADHALMERLIRDHAELRERYVQALAIHARLARFGGAFPAAVEPAARPRIVTWRLALAIAALAACIGLVVLGIGIWTKGNRENDEAQNSNPTPVGADEPTTAAIAMLGRMVDAVWAADTPRYSDGALLVPRRYRLVSGLAEIEFHSGARVVIEGPCEIELRSSTEAYCMAGRVSAEVPPAARGFRLGVPGGVVVDLGTAFGVHVQEAGAEVHVFKGAVELHPHSQPMLELKRGEAVAVNGEPLRVFPADEAAFPSSAVLELKAAEALKHRMTKWQSAGAIWNADPDLVIRHDFENIVPGKRTMPNRAQGAGSVGPATIVGCGRAEGRWPGKGALEFRGVSDRILLETPGKFSSATLALWVRVNGLDRRFNSLFMADAFVPGAIHWQIMNDGRVRLGVGSPEKPGHVNYDSRVVFTPERFGQWVHLAVVYDGVARQVVHYADGRVVGRSALRYGGALQIGRAELGNWDAGGRRDSAIRHFSGCMDEFVLYRRPLTDAEIVEVYAAGAGMDVR